MWSDEIKPSEQVKYTIVVSNSGPDGATVAVRDTFPALFQGTCTWTCQGTSAATCTAGPVSGDISDAAYLPANSSVTYDAYCTLSSTARIGGQVTNTVNATRLDGPGNASASDTDVIVAP
jgi:hypothetical protein